MSTQVLSHSKKQQKKSLRHTHDSVAGSLEQPGEDDVVQHEPFPPLPPPPQFPHP